MEIGETRMAESLPQMQQNQKSAVQFVDKPKFSKTKSLRPSKKNNKKFSLTVNKPANEQDNDDEDFARAEDSDTSDYDDGVPRIVEIPSPNNGKPADQDKMEITLEHFSNSNDQEILDVPVTQTVDDA